MGSNSVTSEAPSFAEYWLLLTLLVGVFTSHQLGWL